MENRNIKAISVIGLGKLGQPIFDVFKKHYKVIGIDTKYPECYYHELGDITFVIVPTPSLPNNEFTSEYVENVLKEIKQKQIVVIVSTLMPGETDRLQKLYPHLKLIYNPTFVALGSVAYDFTHPDLILIGTKHTKIVHLLTEIYGKIIEKAHFPSLAILTPLEAEIAKLTLNCYITTKITFANQIGNLCYQVGIKPNRILDAVGKDSRIGNKYFKAGLGYGGPCFPRDNLAMISYMRNNNSVILLNNVVDTLNKLQVDEMVYRIIHLKSKKIGFKSLSYKEGSDIIECSQLKMIYDKLKDMDYNVIIGKGEVNIDWRGICE